MKELPQRKQTRLKGYDYSRNGAYFLTLCIKDRAELLCEIVNGHSKLTEYGRIVEHEIKNIPIIRKECIVDKFVIMPNHIHMIVQLVGGDGNRPVAPNRPALPKCADPEPRAEQELRANPEPRADCHPPLRGSVSNMVQGLKGTVTRHAGFSFWQRSFHDHIIRGDRDYDRIAAYIENNPQNWRDDCFYVDRDGNTPVVRGGVPDAPPSIMRIRL
jgi:REP element-mobilizing transposase RayT